MSNTSGFVGALITIVIGLALLPVVRSFVATGQENATASESSLLGLVTLMWIFAVIGVAVSIGIAAYKR